MPKKFLTVKEIAALFSVTPLTVRNWDKKGKLMAYRNPVNNYRVYKVDEVETLMKAIETRPLRAQTANTNVTSNFPRKLKVELE